MANLSLQPYKGTRDFYPEDMFVQNYMFDVMRRVSQSFGYGEYGASILEETALYRAKTGEEIVNEQTYSFTDRGGREVTIRPEMTPTVARMVAQKRKELSFPLRWFSIPNLLRYERPQRGRLREHWQLNVDMFGVDSIEAEKEVILVASSIMKAFGAKNEDFEIRVNNRKLINFLLKERLALSEEDAHQISRLIDRKKKMGEATFREGLEGIAKEKSEALLSMLQGGDLNSLPSELQESEGARELKALIEGLQKLSIANCAFDPTLVRGFDYYTGIVFEVFDTNPSNIRSLFGGGRYDDLVAMFDVEKVSGVGFGMGDVTMRDYLETRGLLPAYRSPLHLYLCSLNEEALAFSHQLAQELRAQKLNIAVDLTLRKLGAQVKNADREKVPFIICIGQEEMATNVFKLKRLETGEEKQVKKEELVSMIK